MFIFIFLLNFSGPMSILESGVEPCVAFILAVRGRSSITSSKRWVGLKKSKILEWSLREHSYITLDVKVYWLARIFRNFDDYPGFQPQTAPA